MPRSLLFSASVLGILLLCCMAVPAIATDVTYSGQKITITQPGTYVLTNDITNSNLPICIEIQASNVVFDGAGHLIDGVDAERTAGIFVDGSSAAVSGVTIRNVRVQDWYYGVYLYEAGSSRIESSTLSSNVFCGAVVYKNAAGDTITGCTVTGNGYGVIYSDCAANGVVSDNDISRNERGLYVYLSDGITVTRNRIESNSNTGIQFHTSGGGTIYNNKFNNNVNSAFTGEPFRANAWSVTPGASWNPANIMGGPKVGGNYWSRPDGTGFSQTNADANDDGFIDIPNMLATLNVDSYPLGLYPAMAVPRGNGTFWVEQTIPASVDQLGVATLYVNNTWSPPADDVWLNLTWNDTVMNYARTDWRAGSTGSADPAGPSGLSLRMSDLANRYPSPAGPPSRRSPSGGSRAARRPFR